MAAATTPIQYPYINGSLFSFPSIELKMNGLIFRGFKSINYKRTRDRAKVYGNASDPLGKTTGKNDYTADAEIYLAEWNAFQVNLGGDGYGDVFFPIYVTYIQNGFDVIQDTLIGCTMDESDASNSEGTDPLVRKVTLNPLKIFFNDYEDLANPLTSPPQ